jgi:hypothetical protein
MELKERQSPEARPLTTDLFPQFLRRPKETTQSSNHQYSMAAIMISSDRIRGASLSRSSIAFFITLSNFGFKISKTGGFAPMRVLHPFDLH